MRAALEMAKAPPALRWGQQRLQTRGDKYKVHWAPPTLQSLRQKPLINPSALPMGSPLSSMNF